VGKRPTEFIAALSLPYEMLETFFELDALKSLIEAKKLKDEQEKFNNK